MKKDTMLQTALEGRILQRPVKSIWWLPKSMTKDNFDEHENKLLGNQVKDENVISSEPTVNVRSLLNNGYEKY